MIYLVEDNSKKLWYRIRAYHSNNYDVRTRKRDDKNHVEEPQRQIFASILGEKAKRELRFYSFIKCLYSKTNYHIIIEAIRLRKMESATQKIK